MLCTSVHLYYYHKSFWGGGGVDLSLVWGMHFKALVLGFILIMSSGIGKLTESRKKRATHVLLRMLSFQDAVCDCEKHKDHEICKELNKEDKEYLLFFFSQLQANATTTSVVFLFTAASKCDYYQRMACAKHRHYQHTRVNCFSP